MNLQTWKNWSSLCDTIFPFERSQSNQFQNRARFYSGGVCFFIVNNKVLGGRVWTRSYELYQDKHRSGRPKEVTTTAMVKKIHKMVLDDHRLKVLYIAYWLKIWTWENCTQDGCRVYSQWNKNSVVRLFQSSVWRCFTAIKPIFCVDS